MVHTMPTILTDLHKEHYTNIAKHMTQALIEATDISQSMPWKIIHEKQFSIYRAEISGGGPCNVHAVTKVNAHIEEVVESLITTTTESYKTMMGILSSEFVDGAVVANILTPTPEHPHRYVGLKWVAFKSSSMSMSKDKDFIIIEYIDLVEGPNGQKTAFRIMQSIGVSDTFYTPPNASRYTREQVPLVGFIYYTTPKDGELRMTYSCNVDTKDSPSWIANIAIQVHVEKSISRTLKYIEFQRLRNDNIELPQRVIPMTGETGACHVCEKKFLKIYRPSYSCLKCAKYVCSNCFTLRTAAIPDVGERKLRICTACVIQVRQARRGSHDLKKENFEPTSTCDEALLKRQALDDCLAPVCRIIAMEHKAFSSNPQQSLHSSRPPAEKLAHRRVTVGPSQLTPQLAMFKEGLPSLLQHQISDKRRSTVGHTDLKASLTRFHQEFSAARAVDSYQEDHETSDDESLLVSSDSEDDEDEDTADEGTQQTHEYPELTESSIEHLNVACEWSRQLQHRTEENNKMANILARQLSDNHSASHSRKSSQSSIRSNSRKTSTGTIVLFDIDHMRKLEEQKEQEKLRAFLASKGEKRRSSNSEGAKRHPPASSSFMF